MEIDYWEDFNEYIEEINPKVGYVDARKYEDLIKRLKQEEQKQTKVISLIHRTA